MYNFLLNWFAHSLNYFEVIFPWLILGILISYLLKRNLNERIVKRFLGKSRFRSVILAEIIGASSPVSIIALLPLVPTMLSEGANPTTLIAFLLAARAYNPEALPVSISLLGLKITLFNILITFIGVTLSALSLDGADFKIPLSNPSDDVFFKEMLKIVAYIVLGILIAGLIITAIPSNTILAYSSNGIVSIFLSIVFGFCIYLGFVGYFPIAKAFLDLGLNHSAIITFLSSASIINLTFLLMFIPIIGKKNAIKIISIYLFVLIISGLLMLLFNV